MSLGQDIHRDAGPPDGEDEIEVSAPMDLIISDLASSLDDIEEPSPEELAELDDFVAEAALEAEPLALLAALNEPLEKPELVSLESLDEIDELDELDDDLDEELDEEDSFIDPPIDSYIDIDLDGDGDLNDEGYDLDDDAEIADYQDLYGEDDGVVPSFREGELDDDDDEGGAAFYDDLR